MIDEKRKKEAKTNFDYYIKEDFIKKEQNNLAKLMYIKNAELSLQTASELMQSPLKPYLW